MKNALDTARTANNGTGRCPSRSEGHRERWHPLNIVLGTPENPVAASQQRAGRYRVTMVMLRYCSVGVPKEFRRSSEGLPWCFRWEFGRKTVFPSSTHLLTALVWPLFKRHRIFFLNPLPAAVPGPRRTRIRPKRGGHNGLCRSSLLRTSPVARSWSQIKGFWNAADRPFQRLSAGYEPHLFQVLLSESI